MRIKPQVKVVTQSKFSAPLKKKSTFSTSKFDPMLFKISKIKLPLFANVLFI